MDTVVPAAELDLGPCCACGCEGAHRNIICLPFEGPPGFSGWGCFVCKLECRGAMAILCDACVESHATLRFIAGGRYTTERVRVPLETFEQKPFNHDNVKHAAMLPAARC